LVLPAAEGPFAPLAAAAAAGATVFPTVPAYLRALTGLAEPPPLASLRLVLSAGAPLAADTSVRFRQRFGRSVHVFYGASECGGICYDREGGAAERGTVGAPVDGVSVELVPVAGGAPAESGGRVVVRSPAVALGCLPREPSRLAGGRYASDDLGRWHGGELALVGRLNELINVRGKKVDPREVEKVLTALAPVEEALVTAVPGPVGAEQRVRAVVACRPGALSAQAVVAWCRRHLADHKVPRSVVLVAQMPRNERGKVDRAALAALMAADEPAPR
jgi:acyl-coenzyme A synthetase/AMP-(fatty) acid ligase